MVDHAGPRRRPINAVALVIGGFVLASAIIYGDTFGLLFAVGSIADGDAACRDAGRASVGGAAIMIGWTVFAAAPVAVAAARRRSPFLLGGWVALQAVLLLVAAALIADPPGLFCFNEMD